MLSVSPEVLYAQCSELRWSAGLDRQAEASEAVGYTNTDEAAKVARAAEPAVMQVLDPTSAIVAPAEAELAEIVPMVGGNEPLLFAKYLVDGNCMRWFDARRRLGQPEPPRTGAALHRLGAD